MGVGRVRRRPRLLSLGVAWPRSVLPAGVRPPRRRRGKGAKRRNTASATEKITVATARRLGLAAPLKRPWRAVVPCCPAHDRVLVRASPRQAPRRSADDSNTLGARQCARAAVRDCGATSDTQSATFDPTKLLQSDGHLREHRPTNDAVVPLAATERHQDRDVEFRFAPQLLTEQFRERPVPRFASPKFVKLTFFASCPAVTVCSGAS
jgi:hypothetical protein